jgi:GNAT superfamily N-acetyltransferase
MPHTPDEIPAAIECFVRGFSFQRSFTHLCTAERVGKLWVIRDALRKNPRNYRKEEWVAYKTPSKLVDTVARRETRGRYFIGSIHADSETEASARAEFKRLGYRLLDSETLFSHCLKRIPQPKTALKIERVLTEETAVRLGKATRSRPIPAHYLTGTAPLRQYIALDGSSIVGWVRSIDAGDSAWCADMFVEASYRRRGIGSAMVARMLRDDRALGTKRSVLLASHAGALFYPHLGYERLATLLIFVPKKR